MSRAVDFRQRWPWFGADLQTLRDTLRPEPLPVDRGQPLTIPLPSGDSLLVLRDLPTSGESAALVVLVHGLAGDSGRQGVRRLAGLLQHCGFEVWRLNLRGAGAGRALARGSYAAACTADLLPVLEAGRARAAGQPLLGVGLSLGGTILLNAVLEVPGALDGLACVSSPLDLQACSQCIAAPRNRLYERWLLRRLIAQTLADPFGLDAAERHALEGPGRPRSIRGFDAAVTAPRWGYISVDHYYVAASPASALRQWLSDEPAPALAEGGAVLPPALLLHAADDPWVPAAATAELARSLGKRSPLLPWQVQITPHGGHNGFHDAHPWGGGPVQPASWADRRVAHWLLELLELGAVSPSS
jgi:predicted alpha/beta-fold hydrolase